MQELSKIIKERTDAIAGDNYEIVITPIRVGILRIFSFSYDPLQLKSNFNYN